MIRQLLSAALAACDARTVLDATAHEPPGEGRQDRADRLARLPGALAAYEARLSELIDRARALRAALHAAEAPEPARGDAPPLPPPEKVAGRISPSLHG